MNYTRRSILKNCIKPKRNHLLNEEIISNPFEKVLRDVGISNTIIDMNKQEKISYHNNYSGHFYNMVDKCILQEKNP